MTFIIVGEANKAATKVSNITAAGLWTKALSNKSEALASARDKT